MGNGLPEITFGQQHFMRVLGTCGFISPHPPLSQNLFLETIKETVVVACPHQGQLSQAEGSGLEVGQEAPRDSPTFFLCRALSTPTTRTPSASTRARGTRVETTTLELPPCPAELEEGFS